MKKIIFNGKILTKGNLIGVGRYTYELIKAFDKICAPFDVEIVIPDVNCSIYKFDNIRVVRYGKNVKLWEQIFFWRYVRNNKGICVNLDGVPPFFMPGITCKHDVTHLINPQIYIDKNAKRFMFWIRHLIVDVSLRVFSKEIITVSKYSKNKIAKYYHISKERIDVVSNSWQHFENICEDDNIFEQFKEIKKGSYFLGLGAQNRNKNFRWFVENAKLYSNNQYVIAGKFNSDLGNGINYSKCSNIIFVGYVSDGKLKSLMRECKAFVFPSFYEGFGIPPLEAMSMGKRAIVSDIEIFREIYEDSVYYIDPNNPAIDLCKLMQLKEISNESVDNILKKYSWDKSAKKLLEVLYKYDRYLTNNKK